MCTYLQEFKVVLFQYLILGSEECLLGTGAAQEMSGRLYSYTRAYLCLEGCTYRSAAENKEHGIC